MPEVLAPAKLESICAVVVVPHILEPAHRPAVGNDEEKAQKLSMHPPRGRHDAGQEGIGDTIAVGVALAIPINLGARSGLEELCRVGRAQRPVAGDISHVVAPELVVERNVNDEVAVPPNVDVHEHQVSPPNFPVALRHRGDVAPLGLDAGLEAECLECVQEGLVGGFGAARVLLAGVDVVTECIDDMTSTCTHSSLTSERHQLRQWHPQEPTEV